MIEVSPNHLLLQIESKSFKLSCIRFVVSSSCKTYAKEHIMNLYLASTKNLGQILWRTFSYDFCVQFFGKANDV